MGGRPGPILSLVFMLGGTTLLWFAARRRYGRRAAFFAAALFAVLGPTLHLGAFATYTALSLLLAVALAAWCVLRAGQRGVLPGRMIAAGAALALANATSYSTVLFDVLVMVLVVLAAFPGPGGRGRGPAGRHRGGLWGSRVCPERKEGPM